MRAVQGGGGGDKKEDEEDKKPKQSAAGKALAERMARQREEEERIRKLEVSFFFFFYTSRRNIHCLCSYGSLLWNLEFNERLVLWVLVFFSSRVCVFWFGLEDGSWVCSCALVIARKFVLNKEAFFRGAGGLFGRGVRARSCWVR